ncbi:MAG: BatA domain-containing protein [Prolixibacteraceae bacterium]|jgi:hypothetical protein|nr:BatA domain-containing protein [Prolixibacteraceae bacterium]
MSFIYPSFLWALLFIAVPILIHFVNLRKHRTVYFSNVSLLKKVRKETKRKSKLKQLLILASRILLITAAVLAFSKPYIPSGNTEKQRANKVVGIYIDNSFSMNAEGAEGKAINNAKQKAYAIVNGSKYDTKFALLSNSLNEQQNRFYSRSEIVRLISEVENEHNSVQLSTIQLRFNSMMENFLFETDKTVYLISDFQQHTSDLDNFKADTLITYNFIPIQVNSVANIYIDTCWFDAPTHHFKQVELLNVKIVNHSGTDYPQVPINFYLNDSLKALASTQLEPGEEKVIQLQYSNSKKGLQKGRIEISDYPIVYDNNLYLSYTVKSSLNALLIANNNSKSLNKLKALFSNDDYIKLDVERSDRLQISSLTNYSTLILNESKSISSGLSDELLRYVDNGGTLIIIPNSISDTESYNSLFRAFNSAEFTVKDTVEIPIGEVDYNQPLFAEVFKDEQQKVTLPNIKNRYRFASSQTFNETAILSYADQSNALTLTEFGNGKLYVLSFALSDVQNHFSDHLLFLPTFYNMVLQSSFIQQLYYVIGKDKSFEVNSPNRTLSQNLMLKHLQSGLEIIPSIDQQKGNKIRLATNSDFDAGFYEIYLGEELVDGLSFNYQLSESDLTYYSESEIGKLAEKAGIKHLNLVKGNNQKLETAIEELDNGKQLWKLFIALGILFLLCEAAIIRFWP